MAAASVDTVSEIIPHRVPGNRRDVAVVRHLVNADARAARNTHRGAVIWLTGLSGSGKSTLAMGAEQQLFEKGYQVYVLDGDNIRRGVNKDLGFEAADRHENVRRVGEIAALFADAGIIVFAALISPFQADRDEARAVAPGFYEVYVKASLSVCEGRDPRGLYRKARSGALAAFTGVSSPYEEPVNPDLTIDTEAESIERSVGLLVAFIEQQVSRIETSAGA